jgi:hypothetical protein
MDSSASMRLSSSVTTSELYMPAMNRMQFAT